MVACTLLIGHAGAAERRLPRATAQAPRQVLVGIYRDDRVRLVGTWHPHRGWRAAQVEPEPGVVDESRFRHLLPRGGEWELHRVAHPPVRVRTGPATAAPVARPDGNRYEAAVTAPRGITARLGREPWLALLGGCHAAGGAIVAPSQREAGLVSRTRRQLVEAGLLTAKAHVLQDLAADLNGDGRQDRVLTFATGLLGDTNIVVAVLARRSAETTPVVLTRTVRRQDQHPDVTHVLAAQVTAIVDINGDRCPEVVVSWGVPDGNGVDVYAIRGKTARCVLRYANIVA